MEEFIGNAPVVVVLLLLVAGFVLLIKGADFFVEGSSSVAKTFQVPSIIIGLTVVAMGTSLPETAVSVTASMAGKNELAISNAIGSNIFNLMVVIGVCALLAPVYVNKKTIQRDIPFSILCALILLVFGSIALFDKGPMILGHVDGVILLVLFVGYLISLVRRTLKEQKAGQVENKDAEEIAVLPVWKSLIFIVGGAIAIMLGGDLSVDAASRIASDLGMSQTLIGLTIVSIGTSLPELCTSFVAARKNEVDMALGNAIGSNIFNILMVLGVASAISPISFLMENMIDVVILVVFSLFVWLFAATKKRIDKAEGAVMLLAYLVFAVYICIR